MNGITEWKLNESELQTVYDGNIGAYIPCPTIIRTPIIYNNSKTPDGDIAWSLSLYPTGNDHNTAQYAYISIHTRSIPSDIANIYINYDIKINEINSILWSEKNVNINKKHLLHILQPFASQSIHLQSYQLKNCKTITFKITITMNNITSKRKTQRTDPPLQPIPNPTNPINPQSNNNNINPQLKSPYGTPGFIGHGTRENDEYELKCDENDIKSDLYDNYEDNILDYECYPSCIIPHFKHCIQWTIRGKQYGRFIHSDICKSFETHWFSIDNNFRFKLCVFPNGHKQEYCGFIIIYLDIERLPENISNIRIHWNFNCLETGTHATSIKDLNNSRLGTMVWLPNQLKLQQLYNITTEKSKYKYPRITFILQLNIFHIQYYSKPINSQHQHITQYKNDMKLMKYNCYNTIFNKQFAYEKCILIWKLNEKLIECLKSLCYNQSFNSPQFDIWIIRIYPKGINNNDESFILSLKLLPYYLHRDIGGVLVRIMFECPQLGLSWNDIGSFNMRKGNRSCNVKWDISNILKWNHLLNIENNQIVSFEFKVQIIKLFGFNNQEIDDLDKYKYLKREEKEKEKENDELDENKWNMMRLIKDLQKDLKDTKSELMSLKKEQKENLVYEKVDENGIDIGKIIKLNDIKLWFDKVIGLQECYDKFINDGFEDFETIIEINQQDLVEMNIHKKGHRIKIMKGVEQIKQVMNQK